MPAATAVFVVKVVKPLVSGAVRLATMTRPLCEVVSAADEMTMSFPLIDFEAPENAAPDAETSERLCDQVHSGGTVIEMSVTVYGSA